MSQFLDRRPSGSRSQENRDRLLRRLRPRLREAVENLGASQGMDALSRGDKSVVIPTRDLHEPHFRHNAKDGAWDFVLPGNEEYQRGDRIPRPVGGQGTSAGTEGSADGEGEEILGIALSQSEFLELLFDGLALPNLHPLSQELVEDVTWAHAGFVRNGSPTRLHIGRSMRAAKMRRSALRATKVRALRACEEELRSLLPFPAQALSPTDTPQGIAESAARAERIDWLRREIQRLQKQIQAIPFLDESDLRFAHSAPQAKPRTQAVMFCVMDVSGSMGEAEKDLSKRFFLLLYLFLQRQYQETVTVFIKHHHEARECTEEEFFRTREGGGTLVSPALELVQAIQQDRYPAQDWNCYLAQASDGDNHREDNAIVAEKMTHLAERFRGLFYLEVNRSLPSELLQLYESLSVPHLRTISARQREEIYPLFRKLFSTSSGQEARHV